MSDNQGIPHDYLMVPEPDVYRLIIEFNNKIVT